LIKNDKESRRKGKNKKGMKGTEGFQEIEKEKRDNEG